MPPKVKIHVPRALNKYPDRLVRAVENALTNRAEDIKIDFQVTTQTWKHQPQFKIQRGKWRRLIYTRDKIYLFVTAGTRPHRINARPPISKLFGGGAGYLRFYRSGFRPKTRVGRIVSFKGARATKGLTIIPYPFGVNHPGTEARKFEKVIAEKWQKRFPKLVNQALKAEAAKIRREVEAAGSETISV